MDSPAADAFVVKHRSAAVALAAALTGRRDVAEEIAQESMLKVLARLDELREPQAFLRVVVVNACRSWHRSSAREMARLQRWSNGETRVSPETVEMLDLLDRLPYRHRASLQLRFWGGWTDDEIAAALRCRPASVRVFVRRGLLALRASLDGEESA